MKGDKLIIILAIAFFSVLGFSINVSALSNDSIIANESLSAAYKNILLMQEKDIPVNRVNDLFNEASQLYDAQTALEEKGKKGNYDLIISYSLEVNKIKEDSFRAHDELDVFIETYNLASKDSNLSGMQSDYDSIIASFEEERFEDTLKLIEEGYNKISEIQSSQTSLRLFYEATTKSIKRWFYENWKSLVLASIVLIIIYIISYKSLKRIMIKKELKNLILKKSALNNLIKKIQLQYFKDSTISETEFKVKVERFKEMIRDVDRQIPLLNEKLAKLDYKNKPKDNPLSADNMVKSNVKRKKNK